MSQNVITERQMFESVISSRGRSTDKDASGDYVDDLVRDYWYAWKLRADVEKARDTINTLNNIEKITGIFNHTDTGEKDLKELWLSKGFPDIRRSTMGIITGEKK